MAKIHLVANTFQIKELFKVVATYADSYYLYDSDPGDSF